MQAHQRNCSAIFFLFLLLVLSLSGGCAVVSHDEIERGSNGGVPQTVFEEEMRRKEGLEAEVPQSSTAHYNFMLGELALNSGSFAEALRFFGEAAKYETGSAPALRSRLAQLYVRAGRLQEALAEIDKTLQARPDDRELLGLRAGILATLHDTPAAIQTYEHIVSLSPEVEEEPYILMASLYAQEKDYKAAREKLNELLSKKPDSFFGYYYSAKIAEVAGDYAEAEALYAKALALNPEADAVHLDLARLYAAQKRFDRAAEVCEKVIAADPANIAARNLLAQLLLGQNRIDEALHEFEEVGKLEDDPSKTRFKIALIKLQRRDFDGAAVELSLLLAQQPDNAAARYYLASAYAGQDKYLDAVVELEKIKKGQQYYVEAKMLSAYLLRQQKQYQRAIHLVEETIGEQGEDVRLLALLSSLFHDINENGKAVAVAEKIVKLEPDKDAHYFTLGVYLDGDQRREEALECMEKAIELNPRNANALNYLGYSLAEKGERLDEAESFIRRALEVEADNGYFVDSLGWVFYRMSRFQDALREMERAVQLVPEDAVILEHYGMVLLKLDRKEEAMTVFEKALGYAPESDDKEVGGRLQSLLRELKGG